MACSQYSVVGSPTIYVEFTECGGGTNSATVNSSGLVICAEDGTMVQEGGSGTITQVGSCSTNPLEYVVGFGGAPEDACYPMASAIVTGDTTNFCTCTTFTGAVFAAVTFTGTYYVSYLGNSVAVFVTSGNPVATVTGVCTACPGTTTTTSTTTTSTSTTTTSTTTTSTTSTTTTTTSTSTTTTSTSTTSTSTTSTSTTSTSTTSTSTTTTSTTTTTTAAPVVSPVVSVTAPLISVSLPYEVQGVGISYQQFLNSLGKYNYGVEFFYMWAQTYPEIGQPVYFTHFQANGNQIATYLPFSVDPYQSQPSIYYEGDPSILTLDGLSSLTFSVFPSSSVFLKLFTTITYLGNELDDIGMNNFEVLEAQEGMKFFDDYCNYLIDTPQE